MRFKTKTALVEAFEVTPNLSEYRIEMLFKVLGFELTCIKKENRKPFFHQFETLEFTLLDSHKQEITISCLYGEYICLQNDVLVISAKSDFESEFEPIEPILDNIAHQTNSMAY
jgi:hypothetical protein